MSSSAYRCNICNKEYVYQKSYLEHYKTHNQMPMQHAPQHSMGWNNQPQYIQMPMQYSPQLAMGWSNQALPVTPYYTAQHPIPVQHSFSTNLYYAMPNQYTTPMEWFLPQSYDNQNVLPIQYLQGQQLQYQVEGNRNEDTTSEINSSVMDNNTIAIEEDMDISNILEDGEEPLLNKENNFLNVDTTVDEEPEFYEIDSAFKNNIVSYGIPNKKDDLHFKDFIKEIKAALMKKIESSLNKNNIIKFIITLIGEYIKIVGEEMDLIYISHRAKMSLLCRGDNIDEMVMKQLDEIHNKMSEFQERDSGWTLIRIVRLEININKSSLVKGALWISSPEKLAKRHACINIENTDNYCFKWSVIAALSTSIISNNVNQNRCSIYNIENIDAEIITLENNVVLDFTNLKFPLKLKDIKKFEDININISINVFGYDEAADTIIGPFYCTKEEKPSHINLLLLENDRGHHYIFINNMSK